MSVRDAVATREGNGAPATVSTADVVKQMISRQSAALGAVLPDHLDADRYARLTITAVKANPKLMAAFTTHQGQMSVLLAAMQAAALGLEPNTPTQECWIQPRRVKNDSQQWVDEAELSIGYKGYAKLARRSGQVKELFAGVVREGDEFDFARGLGSDTFHHKQLNDSDDESTFTHAYAVARLTNGGVAWVVLNRGQIEKRRAMSESWRNERARPYSPWTKWPEEQWSKTAIRHLLTHGQVELSPELARAASTDEQPLQMDDDGMIDALVIDTTPELGRGEPASPPTSGEGGPDEAGGISSEGPPPVPSDQAIDPLHDNKALAALAVRAFPCDDAPRGSKTRRQTLLRYALTFVATSRKEWHLDRLDNAQRRALRELLDQVIAGKIDVAPDWADSGGVDFTRGDETHTIEWSEVADDATPEPGE